MPDAYSYYEDLLKRAGENPDKYKNATPGIEKLGDKLYGESEVTDDQVNNYLPEAKLEKMLNFMGLYPENGYQTG